MSQALAATGQAGDVDLSPTPPDLDASVDPNIVVSFDDSGSMASNFMGDNRPFDNAAWGGPWECAGVIGGTSPVAGHGMNGTYYNPNVLYVPPVFEDGTSFPNADANLAAVWADGVAINRPVNAVGAATAALNNNPNSAANGSDNRVTKISIASGANCTAFNGSGTCTGTDHRWTCGNGSASPLDGVHIDPVTHAAYVKGGPYYYRLKSTVTIPVDTFGNPTSGGRTTLYTAANWEAVAVPNATATIQGVSVNQWLNFANWYAYYRTRNIMTRTALSRTFGQFGDNIRVAWQTIWPFCSGSCGNGGTWSTAIGAGTIITNLNDTQTGAAANYRKAFFNFLFQVGANGNTPDRLATIRAGEFFRRPSSTDLKDPYFQPDTRTPPGRELSCRQNFHMLVTDGYWNETNPTPLPSGFFGVQNPPSTLPDGTAFSRSDAESKVFTHVPVSPTGSCNDGASDCYPSMADIAFFYWAKDLRSDLANTVPFYVPDETTGITNSIPLTLGQPPLQNKEVYYNPVNDPATWQHVVQFMVTLGIAGNLQYSNDVDCTDPNNDICKLRKDQANSAGITGWPLPVRNRPQAIDDTWHAAINSRGSYFSASDPGSLVQHLTDIINNILSRRGNSTSLSATMSTLSAGTQGYFAGYDLSDYSGQLLKKDLDPVTAEPGATRWDAGCILTGNFCLSTGLGDNNGPPARDPNTRVIFTANSSANGGQSFRWSSLTTAQQATLNQDPASALVCAVGTGVAPGCDGNGQNRLDWLRGVRTHETTLPLLRKRGSVLGAIINSQPVYVSAPTGGFSDNFPAGSLEAVAATPDVNGAPGAGSYAQFVFDNRARAPTVYVGSNDGMMHAFNGIDGTERWAYVPGLVMKNGHLDKITSDSYYKTTVTVDNTPVVQDVFLGGSWKTVLLGSFRLGGRGIFALDVTNPSSVTESNASNKVLWEIDNTMSGFTDLGYTYSYPNIARLSTGQWVVLLASSYFPLPNQTPVDPASNDPAANRTSLFVIDLATGHLIAKLSTSSAPEGAPLKTFGLSTAAAYDLNSDFVDDVAVAGDLAGNLWRFDLTGCATGVAGPSSPPSSTMACSNGSAVSSSNWKVDFIFKSYGTNTADIGRMPISIMPIGMRDRAANVPMWVFGTGKFLGLCDRTASTPPSGCGADANTATQSIYGVRDYGNGTEASASGITYPFIPAQMNSWSISQDSAGVRTLTPNLTVSANRGWKIPLNVNTEPGERVIVTPVPFYVANFAVVSTLIPKGDDPCDPGRRGAIMVLDGQFGAPPPASPLGGGAGPNGSGNSIVGQVVNSQLIPTAGIPAVIGSQGGPLLLPGLPQFSIPAPPPHRGAWRELLDLL